MLTFLKLTNSPSKTTYRCGQCWKMSSSCHATRRRRCVGLKDRRSKGKISVVETPLHLQTHTRIQPFNTGSKADTAKIFQNTLIYADSKHISNCSIYELFSIHICDVKVTLFGHVTKKYPQVLGTY